MSSAWTENWWLEWGVDIKGKRLGGGRGSEGFFYVHDYRWKGLPIRSLQFIGTGDRSLSTPRAEYLGIPDSGGDDFLDVLLDEDWTEAVFQDVIYCSKSYWKLLEWASKRHMYLRTVHTDRAYQVFVNDDFFNYLSRLGSNTRLKLYNRRKRVAAIGPICEEFWSVEPFLSLLNEFHEKRWGVPCFNGHSLRFHRKFLADIVHEGGRLDLRVLTVGGEPVSALYNLVWNDRVYNIQSGFLENFGKDIALGTLHLGYALEDAFGSDDLAWFDLLAGHGKKTDYKRHLATHEVSLVSLMMVRHPFYRLMYAVLDWWKSCRA